MYSIGLVVYVMLTGLFPYLDWENRKALKKQIEAGEYDRIALEDCGCSKEAREFVKLLLTLNPKDRLSAEQALEHPWINFESPAVAFAVPNPDNVLTNLRYFHPQFKL